jgi:uncharacterized protein
MYLVDTNIFLELFLDQEKASEAEKFLERFPLEELYLTEFSFYSIGIALVQKKWKRNFYGSSPIFWGKEA